MRRLITALILLAAPAHAGSFADYAAACRAEIGDIPAFSCADGVTVPITVGGQTPATYTKDMTCDRPALLPNGADSDGQCVPYSRILNLSDAARQVSVMCRQKHIRPEGSLQYDEIADSPVAPDQLDAAIEDAIGQHICRCTGYVRYYEAVKEVALEILAEKTGVME